MIGTHYETLQIDAGHSVHFFILMMQAAQPGSFQDILADFVIQGNNRGTEGSIPDTFRFLANVVFGSTYKYFLISGESSEWAVRTTEVGGVKENLLGSGL
jgi:hypothetical protein